MSNAHFFITRLYKIGQKPNFRQCYFLGNILVPVSEDPGEAAGYRPVAARLSSFAGNNRLTASTLWYVEAHFDMSKYTLICRSTLWYIQRYFTYQISTFFFFFFLPYHLSLHRLENRTKPISTPYYGRRWWDSNLRTPACKSPPLPLCYGRRQVHFAYIHQIYCKTSTPLQTCLVPLYCKTSTPLQTCLVPLYCKTSSPLQTCLVPLPVAHCNATHVFWWQGEMWRAPLVGGSAAQITGVSQL